MKLLQSLRRGLSHPRLHSFKADFPDALKVDRPFHKSTLPNGMVAASEIWPSEIVTINVVIKCGSRNETKETSGTAHFLEHLHFKGTQKRTRVELEFGVQKMGGRLDAFTSRELTCYTVSVFKDQLEAGVELLGDMLSCSLYDANDVERERSTIYAELMETGAMNPLELQLEMSHRFIYQNHQMGLPILGDKENIQTISRNMIVEYHRRNYATSNMIAIATGPVDHARFEQALVSAFARLQPKAQSSEVNELAFTKPKFNGGVILIPENLPDLRVSLNYEAPSYFGDDFYSVLILQRLIGDKPQTLLEQQIMRDNDSFKFQHFLAHQKDVLDQKGYYTAYRDAGIYGNFFTVKPKAVPLLQSIVHKGYTCFSEELTEEQLERAKRKVYIELMKHESQFQVGQSIANYLLYYGRHVGRREVGERVKAVTVGDIKQAISKYVINKPSFMCIWGKEDSIKPYIS